MAHINYKNKKVFYEVFGNGPPIVYVHEWSNSSRYFKKVNLKYFIQKFSVVIIDLPGYGQSEFLPEIKFDDFSHIVLDIVNELKLDKVIIMGFCLGANISLDFTAKNPDRVNNMIIIEPTLKFPLVLYFLFLPLIGKYLYHFVTKNKFGFHIFSSVMVGKDKIKKKILHSSVKTSTYAISYTYLKALNSYGNRVKNKLFESIYIDTLCIQGENTLKFFADFSSKMHHFIHNSTLVIIKGGKHYLFAERPRETYEVINNYIQKKGSII